MNHASGIWHVARLCHGRQPGEEEIAKRKPRRLGGGKDTVDILNQFFVGVVDDVAGRDFYPFGVFAGDGDTSLEAKEDRLSNRTVTSP
jgi:hypothetical protein